MTLRSSGSSWLRRWGERFAVENEVLAHDEGAQDGELGLGETQDPRHADIVAVRREHGADRVDLAV
jgi:hypothetical protein